MTPPLTRAKIAGAALHNGVSYPVATRLAGYLRRRTGLAVIRIRNPRAEFGTRCDIRSGSRITMASGAAARFGPRCTVDRMLTLETSGTIDIGADTIIGHHCTIAARSSVVIGSDCLIAELVSIRDHDHATAQAEIATRLQGDIVAPVRIGNNVWLGAKVTVVKGVTIGDGAVVGANAVVTHSIPPGAVAVGVPARVIGHR